MRCTRGGDELNLIQAGSNYGWISVTAGEHYNGEPAALGNDSVSGMQDPVLFWKPSINAGNLTFYDGDRFPAWRGDLLIATMSKALLRVRFDGARKVVTQERMLTELGQRRWLETCRVPTRTHTDAVDRTRGLGDFKLFADDLKKSIR